MIDNKIYCGRAGDGRAGGEKTITSILVYDVTGKQVLTERPSTTANAYTISTKQLSTGVYIVKASLDNSKTFTKKVIIN